MKIVAGDLAMRADVESQPGERLLLVAQVAKRINRCQEQVRRYIRAGRLRAVRPVSETSRPGNYLVPESAVREFLATSRNTTAR